MHRYKSNCLPALLAGVLLLVFGTAQATTYNVEHDAGTDTLQLRDLDAGAVVATSATGCCDVVAGGLDTDANGSRLFALDSSATGQHLVTLSLPTLGAVYDVALSGAVHFTSPRFNAASGVLYALAADSNAGTLSLVTLDPATGTSAVVGSAEANCCLLVPGTAALGSDNGILLAVTRALDDATLAISSWDLSTGARTSSAIPADRHIDGLARDPGNSNWLMLYRDEGGAQTLATLELPGTVTPMATLTDCCLVLASTSVFEPGSAGLRFVGRDDTTSALHSYAFGTGGSVQTGATLASSIGLIQTGSASDVIFADGFETLPALAGSSAALLKQIGVPTGLVNTLMQYLRPEQRTNDSADPQTLTGNAIEPAEGNAHLQATNQASARLADPAVPVPTLAPWALLILMLALLYLCIVRPGSQRV